MSDAKHNAEALRERMWSPRGRWRAIQEAVTWAESQRGVSRCTPKACLARQAHLLAGLKACKDPTDGPGKRGR